MMAVGQRARAGGKFLMVTFEGAPLKSSSCGHKGVSRVFSGDEPVTTQVWMGVDA